MKKNRLGPFLIALTLLAALLLPVSALAAESGSTIVDNMHIAGTAALLMDADHGEVLYEQSAHEKRYPASITKVMTTMLAIEAIDSGALSLDRVITVGTDVDRDIGEGGSTQDIKAGEQLTVRDLLYCALIPSANEACNVLAVTVSGDVDTFIVLMNKRAKELGMTGTHFSNTHGYHSEDHYTTAYDIYLMAREAMTHPTFREIVIAKNYVVPATNLSAERTVRSTNALVSTFRTRGYYYEEATGIKTGSTPEAGYCLVSSATDVDGRSLIAVVLGGENVKQPDGTTDYQYFAESARLLKWGFANFERQIMIDSNTMDLGEVTVTLSKEANYVTLHPDGALEATLPSDIDVTKFERKITKEESVEAPIEAGQVLGTVTLVYGGKEYGTLNLVALSNVSRSELLYNLDRVQKFFDQLWVKVVLMLVAVGAIMLIVRNLFFRKRRRRGGSRSRQGSGKYYSDSGRRRR